MSKNNSSWAALGVGVMAVIAVAGWLLFAPAPTAPSGGRRGFVLPVTLAEVQRGDVHPVASLTGTVRAPRRARLGFEVPGVVSELLVREAEQVRAGQTLARLDSSDQDLSVAAREADVALAQRELAKAEAGPRPEEKRRLAAELRRAEAEADLARLEVERGKALLAREVFSQADLDRLVSTLAASEARVAAAKEQFAEARAGTRPEDLAIARAALARAEAALRIARREQAKTVLLAPFAGTIVRRLASVGDNREAREAVVELIDLDELEVFVEIPARFGPRLGSEPRVLLSVDELPELRVEARLDAQIPVADELSRNLTGLIRLRPEQTRLDGELVLKPGMFVRLALALEPLRGALVVPSDALRVTATGTILVRARETAGEQPGWTAEWIPVRALGRDPRGSAVRSLGPPLEAGDEVVVTGVDLAFPGATLAPQKPPSAGEPADVVGR